MATPGYLCAPGGEPYNAETFNLDDYLGQFDPEWLETKAGRVELTRDDPLLFGAVYVPRLLKNDDGEITFSDVHLGLYRDALDLRTMASVGGDRRGYAAPRNSGKSTTMWIITPLWLACHHPTFIAAFSDTGTQSEEHLRTIAVELTTNRLLREDYPKVCTPITNSASMYYAENGFVFIARGIDTGVLGLVDPLNRRPQILLLDDIEGQEGSGYSLYQAGQRLKTITEGILPMNDRARVRVIGTVHLAGGILDDLVRVVTTKDPPAEWITDERFEVTYFEPIITRDDGTERSCWPGKWPVEHLQSIRHTRSYAKAFLNQPLGPDGGYWAEEDITYGEVPAITRRALFVDGIVKERKTTRDRTGIAIVGYSPTDGRCLVEHASGVMLTGGKLRERLARLIARHPRKIHGIVVETNQGGDLWREILGPIGVKVITRDSSDSKAERLALALDQYQKPRPLVVHAEVFPAAEAEMLGFPRYATDDVADAISQGVLYFLKPKPVRRRHATVSAYA